MCTFASGPTNFRSEPGAYTETSPLQYPLDCFIINLYFLFSLSRLDCEIVYSPMTK